MAVPSQPPPEPPPDPSRAPAAARRGRPPGTSARALELVALELFATQGFEETTVEQIASAAGVSRRTFFRYFDSKAAVVWNEFDAEVSELRAAFVAVGPDVPLMTAIRTVVVGVNHYRAEDVPELRVRMNLIASAPALQASAARHYDDWERAVGEFAGRRLGTDPDSLYPLAIGRTTLAACRAAFDRWAARGDADLPVYLDAALGALGAGFALADAAEPAALGVRRSGAYSHHYGGRPGSPRTGSRTPTVHPTRRCRP